MFTILHTFDIVFILCLQPLGPLFRLVQNRLKPPGGAISLIKAFWLVYAITLWMIVPGFVFVRLFMSAFFDWPPAVFTGLLVLSMSLRGILEMYLCYVSRTWKVRYGITHDFFQLALVLIFFVYLIFARVEIFFFYGLAVLTILSLLTESLFVKWFYAATGGPEKGVYFVSDAPEFDRINSRTAWIFLPQYVLFFALLLRELFLSF